MTSLEPGIWVAHCGHRGYPAWRRGVSGGADQRVAGAGHSTRRAECMPAITMTKVGAPLQCVGWAKARPPTTEANAATSVPYPSARSARATLCPSHSGPAPVGIGAAGHRHVPIWCVAVTGPIPGTKKHTAFAHPTRLRRCWAAAGIQSGAQGRGGKLGCHHGFANGLEQDQAQAPFQDLLVHRHQLQEALRD